MIKGNIIFFDDDSDFCKKFTTLLDESGFKVFAFCNLEDLEDILLNEDILQETKVMVFDLANGEENPESRDFKIEKQIETVFFKYRIPILIHSAFALFSEKFKDKGTVWRIEKSGTSLDDICTLIKKLDTTGFLNVFSYKGIIEVCLMQELHECFINQFFPGEIEEILTHIAQRHPDAVIDQVSSVFKRIAIKSLYSSLVSQTIETSNWLNPTEHYYRRKNSYRFWTGDIFVNNENKDTGVIIITPRCNLANSEINEVLVCELDFGDFPTKAKDISSALSNSPRIAGYDRFIPPSAVFKGGKVKIAKHSILQKEQLLQNFQYLITLSDELTNEVIGKFGAYFFRTGITPWNSDEVSDFVSKKQLEK